MTRKELCNVLSQFPEESTVIARTETGDYEISVCAEDIVPADIDANPQGRIIGGLIVIIPVAAR